MHQRFIAPTASNIGTSPPQIPRRKLVGRAHQAMRDCDVALRLLARAARGFEFGHPLTYLATVLAKTSRAWAIFSRSSVRSVFKGFWPGKLPLANFSAASRSAPACSRLFI